MTRIQSIAVVFGVIVSTACGAAGFRFKQDKPSAGSALRFTIGQSSFPLDKGYAQLSGAEATAFKSAFAALGNSDEPPAPSTAMRDLIAFASSFRFQLNDEAHVKVVMQVDRNGVARHLRTETTTNLELEQAVVRVLTATKFNPALCSGEPCEKEFPFEMRLDRATAMTR